MDVEIERGHIAISAGRGIDHANGGRDEVAPVDRAAEAHVTQRLDVGHDLGVIAPVRVDEREMASIGRKRSLADRDAARHAADHAVLNGLEVGGANLVVLEVIDFARRVVNRAEVIVDASQMPFAPDHPTRIPGAAVGELPDAAIGEVHAIEFDPAAPLAVEHEVAIVRGDGRDEVIKWVAVGLGARQLAQCSAGSGIAPGLPFHR